MGDISHTWCSWTDRSESPVRDVRPAPTTHSACNPRPVLGGGFFLLCRSAKCALLINDALGKGCGSDLPHKCGEQQSGIRGVPTKPTTCNKRCIDVVCCYCEQCYAGARNRCFAPMAYMTTTWSCGTRACPVRDKVNIFPTISSSPKHVKNVGYTCPPVHPAPSVGTGGTSE